LIQTSERSKFVLLTRALDYGGAERQMVALSNLLHQRGRQVTVVLFHDQGPLRSDLKKRGVEIRAVGKKNSGDFVGFFLRLIGILRDERPTILHTYLTVPNLFSALLKPALPGVKIVWGVRVSDMNMENYGRLYRWTYWIEAKFSRFADLIIANSEAGRQESIKRGYPAAKIIVIPNGIDTERFHPAREAGNPLRERWGVLSGETLIGLVARIDPMKDHATFLQAAAQLSKQRADIRFICVGAGDEGLKQRLQQMAEHLQLGDRLIWAGAMNDMENVYNALDILTLTSAFGEGFPNVVGEAMACGVPCVVTDVGDAARIVAKTGYVAPRESPDAIVMGWHSLLSQDRESLRQSARRHIVEEFSLARLAHNTEQALWSPRREIVPDVV
jgi:glycosyltransferase involved in cell wall biosynthesis